MMTITDIYNTNAQGYIMFGTRNFRYAGDKMTWARIEGDKITVKKAARGIISRAYESELRQFCEQLGQNFDAIPFGEKLTFTAN